MRLPWNLPQVLRTIFFFIPIFGRWYIIYVLVDDIDALFVSEKLLCIAFIEKNQKTELGSVEDGLQVVSAAVGDKVSLKIIYSNERENIQQYLKIRTYPTYIIIKDNKTIWRASMSLTPTTLIGILKTHLNQIC